MTITLTLIVLVLLIDIVWITSAKPMYASLVQSVQGGALEVNTVAASVAYVFVVIAIVFLVIPLADKSNSLVEAGTHGALVGLCVYGIYNATNAAIFKGYLKTVALLDTLWGTILFAIAGIGYYSMKKMKVGK